ncbi:hypothetical protein MMC25_001059 [Agyrium rufum]|nr:hypothetical protein [Agyrium rufum]
MATQSLSTERDELGQHHTSQLPAVETNPGKAKSPDPSNQYLSPRLSILEHPGHLRQLPYPDSNDTQSNTDSADQTPDYDGVLTERRVDLSGKDNTFDHYHFAKLSMLSPPPDEAQPRSLPLLGMKNPFCKPPVSVANTAELILDIEHDDGVVVSVTVSCPAEYLLAPDVDSGAEETDTSASAASASDLDCDC